MSRNTYFVYEAIDVDGVALYVGATTDPTSRITDHRSKTWWPLVSSWKIVVCDTQEQMDNLERYECAELNPAYNTNLNGGNPRNEQGGIKERILAILESHPCTTAEVRRAMDGYPHTAQILGNMRQAGVVKPVAWTKASCPGGYAATWAPYGSASPEAEHPNGPRPRKLPSWLAISS